MKRNKFAAGAALSTTLASIDLLMKRDEEDEKSQDQHKLNLYFNGNKHTVPPFPSIQKFIDPLFNLPQQSRCEAFQQSLTQETKTAALMRRATIRLLNETSNPIQNMHAKYKVNWREPIGEGAFGAVYMATNRKTGDKVALKKMPKQITDSASFQNEVSALVRVRTNGGHPYICSLRENFEDGKYYYMVLDHVSGGEMFEHLIKLGAYSEADASRMVKEVADALAFLHGIGITHGDLKPENLMLSTTRKADSTIQIVDFGCSLIRCEENSILSQSSAGNTPAYCPPEVLENSKDPITPTMDIWGLGIILYIMLTGLHPFDLNGEIDIFAFRKGQ